MFAVAGRVADSGLLPNGALDRAYIGRNGDSLDFAVAGDGTFVGAFGDESQKALVGVNDAVRPELVARDGYALGPHTDVRLTRDDLRSAFVVTTLAARPASARLRPNYPNPFNPETWIPFELNEDGEVSVVIYDARGALVRRLGLGRRAAGYHVGRASAAHWNGRNSTGEAVSSGVYVAELQAGVHRDTRRIVVSK